MKYYSLENILKEKAQYNIIIGERSNGKTYSVLEFSLKEYCEKGHQLAIIRRYLDDFTGKRGRQMFDAIVANNLVFKYSKGKYNTITYYASTWYLGYYDEKTKKTTPAPEPFCYAFSLNSVEHDKSTAYPKVKNILFDEFLSRMGYLTNEFVLFMNTLSTIIREKDDVRIFMLGNTVNKYSPYFKDMGLTNIEKMKQGTIDLYTYGDTDLKVAVEYCAATKKGKKSDKYFAFNNPKLSMITSGTWEISIYPHLPVEKYYPKDIKAYYFIIFEENILQCEIIQIPEKQMLFTYIHRKTTPIQNEYKDKIYSQKFTSNLNVSRRISKPTNEFEKRIWWFFVNDRVFYQDNEVGEIVRNFVQWSKSEVNFV